MAAVVLASSPALWLAQSTAAAQTGSLGSKNPGLFNLKGTIYFLPEGAQGLPENIATMKAEGVIYTDRLDVPARDFQEGFPGITNRFEWFGVIYTGQFQIDQPGEYGWTLNSDDGSRLWIDGKEVIDHDGQHASSEKDGTVTLSKGTHAIKVWYFQGPATEIALQLFVTPPAGEKKIFVMDDYSAGLKKAISKVHAEATPEGIRVRMDAAILFDTAKSELKPASREAIQAVSELIASYPNATVRIYGFTDSVGDDASNLRLSLARANSVRTALSGAGLPRGITLETKGLGKAQPVASNDTEAGRALNRRVEVFIKP